MLNGSALRVDKIITSRNAEVIRTTRADAPGPPGEKGLYLKRR
jgi:hypothetical protein